MGTGAFINPIINKVLEIDFTLSSNSVAWDEDVTFTAVIPPNITAVSYQWYIEDFPGGEGDNYTLTCDLTGVFGVKQVALVIETDKGEFAASPIKTFEIRGVEKEILVYSYGVPNAIQYNTNTITDIYGRNNNPLSPNLGIFYPTAQVRTLDENKLVFAAWMPGNLIIGPEGVYIDKFNNVYLAGGNPANQGNAIALRKFNNKGEQVLFVSPAGVNRLSSNVVYKVSADENYIYCLCTTGSGANPTFGAFRVNQDGTNLIPITDVKSNSSTAPWTIRPNPAFPGEFALTMQRLATNNPANHSLFYYNEDLSLRWSLDLGINGNDFDFDTDGFLYVSLNITTNNIRKYDRDGNNIWIYNSGSVPNSLGVLDPGTGDVNKRIAFGQNSLQVLNGNAGVIATSFSTTGSIINNSLCYDEVGNIYWAMQSLGTVNKVFARRALPPVNNVSTVTLLYNTIAETPRAFKITNKRS